MKVLWLKLTIWRDSLHQLTTVHAETTKAKWTLIGVAFTESSFFLVPPDVILLAILMVVPERFLYYAGITTISSVLGGIFGYVIGFFFFETIGQWLITTYGFESELARVGELFAANAFWAIFVSAFTPIPYKVFTVSAGFFKIDFVVFVVASIIGRGARFYLLGFLIYRFGPWLGRVIYKYFNWLTILGVLLLLLTVLYFYLT